MYTNRGKRRKKGLAGLDTAIILIAFIITASVLAYVAVSMGIFVTQKAKTTINKGEETASTALSITGNILYASNYPTDTYSYWIYFPVSPSSGVSSVQLSPSTTAISFEASAEGIVLTNIYNYTLLTVTSNPYLQQQSSGGQTYYYYPSIYAAFLALKSVVPSNIFSVASTTTPSTCTSSATANAFVFNYGGTTYCAQVFYDFAFTFPVAGDSLVGSAIAPAGSTVGVVVLFGPSTGHNVFQYQTLTIAITPNIGSPLTVSQYVYQPDGTVSVIG
ncbi:MAG: archaellin/type IV pilin N-terminal domain-containing protein [Thermoprotei archaeon]